MRAAVKNLSFAIVMLLVSMTAAGCIASRENRVSGKYCSPGEESFLRTCIYLKSNGTGMMDQAGFANDIQWELINSKQLKITGQTGMGLILEISDDGKSLSAMSGFAKWEKTQ